MKLVHWRWSFHIFQSMKRTWDFFEEKEHCNEVILIPSAKAIFPNKVHSEVLGVRTSIYLLGET